MCSKGGREGIYEKRRRRRKKKVWINAERPENKSSNYEKGRGTLRIQVKVKEMNKEEGLKMGEESSGNGGK